MRLTVHIAGTAESPAGTYPRQIHCCWRNTPFHMKLVTCGSEPSAVPSGLMVLRALVPNVETLGYCQESLWDEDEILVAWPGTRAPPAIGSSPHIGGPSPAKIRRYRSLP